MQAGDANFAPGGTTAALSQGDTIIGSNTAGNVLGGSLGNDTFTGLLADVKNTIYTDNGKDTITLAAGHTAQNHIGLYVGLNTTNIVPGQAEAPTLSSITDINDAPRVGTWGIGTAQTPVGHVVATTYAGLAAQTGTSADMSIVNNFNVGTSSTNGDVLDFGIGAWSIFGATHGLVAGTMAAGSATLGNAIAQQITPGLVANAADTLLASTDLIILSGTHTNANDVAASLFSIFFAGIFPAFATAHWLVAYNDGAGDVNIADVDLTNGPIAADRSGGVGAVFASDIVQLHGVSFVGFIANASNAVHFV